MTTSNLLFNRYARVTIGSVQFDELDVEFKVRASLRPRHPNTCDLKIYNLSAVSRKTLELPAQIGLANGGNLPLRLEAGYKDNYAQIYYGEVRYLQSSSVEQDVITEVSSGSSEKKIQSARINTSFANNTPPDQVLQAIAKALGVGTGNIQDAVNTMQKLGLSSIFGAGCVLSGNAARALDNFCKSANLEWSVQGGKLQFLQLGQYLPVNEEQAVKLSASTGLISSPTVDTQGVATAVCMMIPYLSPGRKVLFDAKDLQGSYRIFECTWHGQSLGEQWQCKIKAQKVPSAA